MKSSNPIENGQNLNQDSGHLSFYQNRPILGRWGVCFI